MEPDDSASLISLETLEKKAWKKKTLMAVVDRSFQTIVFPTVGAKVLCFSKNDNISWLVINTQPRGTIISSW